MTNLPLGIAEQKSEREKKTAVSCLRQNWRRSEHRYWLYIDFALRKFYGRFHLKKKRQFSSKPHSKFFSQKKWFNWKHLFIDSNETVRLVLGVPGTRYTLHSSRFDLHSHGTPCSTYHVIQWLWCVWSAPTASIPSTHIRHAFTSIKCLRTLNAE